ncbi:AAA family ATPase [Methylobacterium goesingense]|uniref:AAA+ ATPase domain-containing protein n=1 Tax=Methylobacterium goesingense TaxID=243690 RepID=A0ABV2LAZ4_9HYPH|nr:AAA family ATPase [Methylobacterium goesingense]GJD75109.1 Lon protease [Methylobacterium goesingense]
MAFSSTAPLLRIDAKGALPLILAAFPRRLRLCLDTALRIPAAREGVVAEITALVPEAADLAAAWNTNTAAAGADPWCDPDVIAARGALTRFLDHHAAERDVPAARALADCVTLLSCGGDDAAAAARIALPIWLEAEALPGLILHLPALAEAQTALGLGRRADHDEEVDVHEQDAGATLLEAWTEALEAAYTSLNAGASNVVAASAVLSRSASSEFVSCTPLVRALVLFGEKLTRPIADQAGEHERQRRRVAEQALAKARAREREASQSSATRRETISVPSTPVALAPGQIVVVAEVRETGTDRGRSMTKGYEGIIGKPVSLAPVPDLAQLRTALRFEFPYATGLIDRLLVDLTNRSYVGFSPTLVLGQPGVGKSRLISRIAYHLGVGLWRVDATHDSGAAIGGLDRRWANAEPAHPFLAIARYGVANPLMLVDELEKASTRRDYGRLWDSLLPMIEPETARVYPDPAFQTPLDISHVSWLFTANDIAPLPGPLLDRLRVIEMQAPTANDLEALLPPVLAGIAASRRLDPRFLATLDGEEIIAVRRHWRGGSIRRLARLVETVVAAREVSSRRH